MKVIIESENKEGLLSLLGEVVVLMCGTYFYTGKLIGVNETCVKLQNPSIIYETGPFTDAKWKDCQAIGVPFVYVQISAMESFWRTKC